MHITRAITLMCVAEVAAFLAQLKTCSYRRKMQLTHALSEEKQIHFPSKSEYLKGKDVTWPVLVDVLTSATKEHCPTVRKTETVD